MLGVFVHQVFEFVKHFPLRGPRNVKTTSLSSLCCLFVCLLLVWVCAPCLRNFLSVADLKRKLTNVLEFRGLLNLNRTVQLSQLAPRSA